MHAMRVRPGLSLVLLGAACAFEPPAGTGSAGDVGTGTRASTTDDDGSESAPSGDGSGASGSASGSTTMPLGSTGELDGAGTDTATSDGPGTSGGTSSGDSTTGPAPSCSDALLVTGNLDPTTSGDAPFYERLLALGYDVTVVGNAESQASDANGHCLVLLSALGAASDVEDEFRDVPVPVVTWEYNLYDNMRMVDPADTAAWGIADPQDDIVIVDAAHPLAGGAAGTVAIFENGGRIAWGTPAGDAQVVATLPGNASRATLFGFDAGATMAAGFVAPARRVGYPHGETSATTTAAAVDLFEAAVHWAVQ